jgi:hypothetical protein
MQDTALSLATLMIIALPIGAWVLWKRTGQRKQAVLMLILAAILAANVAIWVMPLQDGAAPTQERLK